MSGTRGTAESGAGDGTVMRRWCWGGRIERRLWVPKRIFQWTGYLSCACVRKTPEDDPDISPVSIFGLSLPNSHNLEPIEVSPSSLQLESILFHSSRTFDILQFYKTKPVFRNFPCERKKSKGMINQLANSSLATNISAIFLYFVHHCVLPRLFFMSAFSTISLTPTHFTLVP